ncbi:MAG: type I DNA topoisomerase [Firmicutes bacterium]|nr:type I DNA topoisomerase [Bacillota bacterium]
MGKTLVIVESPAKVKTLSKFLGRRYALKASVGHVRDLPKSQLGVDVDNNYAPKYITIRGKGDVIRELKDSAKKADTILLATDPDREGEAISWHLAYILGVDPESECRIEFNEITENAVKNALKNPRPIEKGRVDAQQARRVLDRLVGYKLSPFLWKKVRPGLSAGRVQSSALKIICDREREIESFESEEYWSLGAELSPKPRGKKFEARFVPEDDKRLSKEDIDKILADLEGVEYVVESINVRDQARRPAPPFITSTLQQEAFRKLGFSGRRTMSNAQALYEGVEVAGEGHVALITYMRTDSTRVAREAQMAARDYARSKWGSKYVPKSPRGYASRKGAQDAHEAIRPTSVDRTPESLKGSLGRDQLRLYTLIWSRFMASQMSDAVNEMTSVDISAGKHGFRATGQKVKFDGFTVIYTEGRDDENSKDEDKRELPALDVGQGLDLVQLLPKQHFTQPPPRYTEATLVKELEKHGIGRPSTYAPIIDTLRKRDYAELDKKRFVPTEVGLAVCDLLSEHFPSVVDLEFTAKMEEKLDSIEEDKADWIRVTDEFYKPFSETLAKAEEVAEKIVIQDEPIGEPCPECGTELVIKSGRYGKFIACPVYPKCTYRRSIVKKLDVKCPKCGGDVVERRSKKGRTFYGCSNYPDCDFVAWNRPTNVKCPICGSFTTARQRSRDVAYKCANAECGNSWKEVAGSDRGK